MDTPIPLELTLHTRCRRCDKCRQARAREWTYRATEETLRSQRTWFATLTLNPAAHVHMLNVARMREVAQAIDFDALPALERFTLVHNVISVEITKYLKRVRFESKASIRYLFVAEKHVSGLPHYHALIHERPGSGPVLYRTLSEQWQLGFSKFNLVTDPKRAGYVCKYLSKDAAARVRASVGYGKEGTSQDKVSTLP